MAQRSFTWFVSAYICIALFLILTEVASASFAPELRFEWVRSGSQLRDLLKDAASYYISAQVGALGIVSIAIGLVTLIAQRQNARREIQVYYRESLAREVVASCVALLVVLCLQIFWPLQLSIRALGIGVPSNNFESALTAVHTLWLAVNLSALAHFVSLSLGFVQPDERETIRRRYPANWIIPNDLGNRLLRARYVDASLAFRPQRGGSRGPMIFFGNDLGQNDAIELESNFEFPVLLYDVRIKLLRWVIQRWIDRCELEEQRLANRMRQSRRPFDAGPLLIFTPSFDRQLRGTVAWCTRRGGSPLTRFERMVVRSAFRFKRVRNEN